MFLKMELLMASIIHLILYLTCLFCKYVTEGSFKSLFDQNKQNKVTFRDNGGHIVTAIHCDDCRNYWLIRDDKKDQIIGPQCYNNGSE